MTCGVRDIKQYIREIHDFPKPGIIFKDITPLLADGAVFRDAVNAIARRYRDRVDMVVGIESRGFLVGAAVAYALGVGVAVVRKPGKLPARTYSAQYELEYGNDSLEIHRDAFGHPCRVVIVDDLLATGGTARATIELVERLGGQVVECAFIIELGVLKGRERLQPHTAFSLVQY
jgi:adenine phosphoribosyltransferase